MRACPKCYVNRKRRGLTSGRNSEKRVQYRCAVNEGWRPRWKAKGERRVAFVFISCPDILSALVNWQLTVDNWQLTVTYFSLSVSVLYLYWFTLLYLSAISISFLNLSILSAGYPSFSIIFFVCLIQLSILCSSSRCLEGRLWCSSMKVITCSYWVSQR